MFRQANVRSCIFISWLTPSLLKRTSNIKPGLTTTAITQRSRRGAHFARFLSLQPPSRISGRKRMQGLISFPFSSPERWLSAYQICLTFRSTHISRKKICDFFRPCNFLFLRRFPCLSCPSERLMHLPCRKSQRPPFQYLP